MPRHGCYLLAVVGLATAGLAGAGSAAVQAQEEPDAYDEAYPFADDSRPPTCVFRIDRRRMTVTGLSLKRREAVTLSMFTRPPIGVKSVRLAAKQKSPVAGPGKVTFRLSLTRRGVSHLRKHRRVKSVVGADFPVAGRKRPGGASFPCTAKPAR